MASRENGAPPPGSLEWPELDALVEFAAEQLGIDRQALKRSVHVECARLVAGDFSEVVHPRRRRS